MSRARGESTQTFAYQRAEDSRPFASNRIVHVHARIVHVVTDRRVEVCTRSSIAMRACWGSITFCCVAPAIRALSAQHPGVAFELALEDTVLNLGRREADVAIRTATFS